MSSVRDESDPLHDLVFRCLEKLEDEGAGAVEALLAEHPDLASAARERLANLGDAGLLPGASDRMPERLGDFRLTEMLGGGGMGVVWAARQESLGREVALKLIRPEQHYFPGARERFRREIEALAKLNHPGIVPIYTVGEQDGVPYIAMERVRGCTLADALVQLDERDPAELAGADLDAAIAACVGEERGERERAPLFDGTWEETCLRIVREVAEALEHAHRVGVLHRDVKPSNVMITRGGRVLVLDFGLSIVEGGHRLTRTGSTLGSLPYVPPEILVDDRVAAGAEGAQFDRRGEVYELGVTLYELLTLKLPFRGMNAAVLSHLIVSGQARPVRRLNRAVSPEAETICQVAMEREPARRYPSAEALARDLTNALERRPIAARRTSAWLRTRRLVQRHPGWSAAAALALIVATLGPTLFAWQTLRAAERVEAESARATAFLGKSLGAIREMLVVLGSEDTRDVPHLERKRRELLEGALVLYEEIAGAQRGAPSESATGALLAEHRMEALEVLGEIHRGLGRTADAEEAFRELLDMTSERLERDPTHTRSRIAAARAHEGLAEIASASGDAAAAIAQCDAGIAVLAAVADEERTGADVALIVVALGFERGRALFDRGDVEGSLDAFQSTLSSVEAQLERDPDDTDLRRLRATLLVGLGAVQSQAGEWPAARASLERGAAALEELLAVTADLVAVKDRLVVALLDLGQLARNEQRLADARAHFGRALELQEDLARSFPASPQRTYDLVNALIGLGQLYVYDPADVDAGYAMLVRARDLQRALVERHPDELDYVLVEGMALASIGTACLHRAQLAADDAQASQAHADEALAAYRDAVERYEHAHERSPDDPEIVRALRRGRLGRADVLLARGAYADAAGDVRSAAELAPDWRDLRMLAGRLVLCAAHAEVDETVDERERAARAAAYLDEALGTMVRAADAGYADFEDLAGSERLAPLRARAGFAELRDRVERAAAATAE